MNMGIHFYLSTSHHTSRLDNYIHPPKDIIIATHASNIYTRIRQPLSAHLKYNIILNDSYIECVRMKYFIIILGCRHFGVPYQDDVITRAAVNYSVALLTKTISFVYNILYSSKSLYRHNN